MWLYILATVIIMALFVWVAFYALNTKIGNKGFYFIFTFGIVFALLAPNVCHVEKVSLLRNMEVQLAKSEINTFKNEAIKQISLDIEQQKASLKTMTDNFELQHNLFSLWVDGILDFQARDYENAAFAMKKITEKETVA